MRFQVQFPEGVPHEVELQSHLVVVGRDPSCDLVLHDVKCSRRHAVIEAGPDGLAIRDTGSANGVFLNERKIERAALTPGDVVRLGDSTVTVLPDEVEGTVVMGPTDGVGEVTVGEESQPPPPPVRRPSPPPLPLPVARAPAAPPALPRAAPAPRVEAEGPPVPRPLTVNVLAALWLMSVPLYGLGGLALAARSSGVPAFLTAALGLFLAALAGALAWGLWSLQPWARGLQIAVAAVGLLVCPFTVASGVVLAYMLMPVGAAAFSTPAPPGAGAGSRQEAGFAAALLGAVLLGALVSAALLLLPQMATRLS